MDPLKYIIYLEKMVQDIHHHSVRTSQWKHNPRVGSHVLPSPKSQVPLMLVSPNFLARRHHG